MHQLTYISSVRPGTTDADVDAILATSRRNNRRDGITGLLVYDGTRFLQALEGETALVEASYRRIKADPRHRATVLLSARDVAARQFGDWDMACERVNRLSGAALTIAQAVDALVAGVPDASTRALFMSFARIERRQAA